LTVICASDGLPYHLDQDGNYWRVYLMIERARTYDVLESKDQAFQAAKAFGEFQKQLVDIPGGRLHETIPDFHNTPKRFENFKKALDADSQNRAKHAEKEIDFFLSKADMASKLLDLSAEGLIPERITHNDTKLNNVMIDDETGEGLCVIDLDTVMPGLALYDFGDMVRTGTSPAAEDERDLSKVFMRMEMFEALAGGYLESAAAFLTKTEVEYLPFSGKLITYEIGLRFITDYLEGDVYFKIHRENHNLDRCRTQMKLVQSIEEQEEEMAKFIESRLS
jgi:Ser/Thr protein kinase RdoA (MazF antagonist)